HQYHHSDHRRPGRYRDGSDDHRYGGDRRDAERGPVHSRAEPGFGPGRRDQCGHPDGPQRLGHGPDDRRGDRYLRAGDRDRAGDLQHGDGQRQRHLHGHPDGHHGRDQHGDGHPERDGGHDDRPDGHDHGGQWGHAEPVAVVG